MVLKNTFDGAKKTFDEAMDTAFDPLEKLSTALPDKLTGKKVIRPFFDSVIKLAFSPITLSVKAFKNISIGLIKDSLKGLTRLFVNLPIFPLTLKKRINDKWESDRAKYYLGNTEKIKKIREPEFG